jgi:hypothetical protein
VSFGFVSPTHKRTEGRAPVWGPEFTSKDATLQGGPAEPATTLNVNVWVLVRGVGWWSRAAAFLEQPSPRKFEILLNNLKPTLGTTRLNSGMEGEGGGRSREINCNKVFCRISAAGPVPRQQRGRHVSTSCTTSPRACGAHCSPTLGAQRIHRGPQPTQTHLAVSVLGRR